MALVVWVMGVGQLLAGTGWLATSASWEPWLLVKMVVWPEPQVPLAQAGVGWCRRQLACGMCGAAA